MNGLAVMMNSKAIYLMMILLISLAVLWPPAGSGELAGTNDTSP